MFELPNTGGSILPTLWIKAYLRIGSHLLAEIAMKRRCTNYLNAPSIFSAIGAIILTRNCFDKTNPTGESRTAIHIFVAKDLSFYQALKKSGTPTSTLPAFITRD